MPDQKPTMRQRITAALEAVWDHDLDAAEFILREALRILDEEAKHHESPSTRSATANRMP
jgi:hypothetical protein